MEQHDTSLSDMNHFATMVNGCESINTFLIGGEALNNDGRYALTVLKLHAADAGYIDGQEGFLDQVKKGANSIKEWFLKLVKAIISVVNDVASQSSKHKKIEKDIEEKEKELKGDAEAETAYKDSLVKLASECFTFPAKETSRVYDEIKNSGFFEDEFLKHFSLTMSRVSEGHKAMKALADIGENPTYDSHEYVSEGIYNLEKSIKELTKQSERRVKDLKGDEETDRKINSGISLLGATLTKFTKILKLWDVALARFHREFALP